MPFLTTALGCQGVPPLGVSLLSKQQPLMEMKLERSESPFSLYSYFFFYQDHSSVLSKSKFTSFQRYKRPLMKRYSFSWHHSLVQFFIPIFDCKNDFVPFLLAITTKFSYHEKRYQKLVRKTVSVVVYHFVGSRQCLEKDVPLIPIPKSVAIDDFFPSSRITIFILIHSAIRMSYILRCVSL